MRIEGAGLVSVSSRLVDMEVMSEERLPGLIIRISVAVSIRLALFL